MDLSGDTVVIRLVLVVVCLVLSAFFSSSETALTTVNLIRIRNLADNGDKAAAWVLKARRDQSKMLGAILIGNNVVNLSASSMLTVLVTDVFGSQAVGAATGVLTLLVLLFGEISNRPAERFEHIARRGFGFNIVDRTVRGALIRSSSFRPNDGERPRLRDGAPHGRQFFDGALQKRYAAVLL